MEGFVGVCLGGEVGDLPTGLSQLVHPFGAGGLVLHSFHACIAANHFSLRTGGPDLYWVCVFLVGASMRSPKTRQMPESPRSGI